MLKRFVPAFGILVLGLAATVPQNAQALPGFKLGVVGAGGLGLWSKSIDTGVPGLTTETSGGLALGGGAAAEIGPISAELLYMTRKTNATLLGVSVSTPSTASLDIPVMFRMGLGPISLGAGGYYSLSLESGGGSTFGLVAGPRLSIPGGLFVDARVNYGLEKFEGLDVTPIEGLVLVGFSFL